MKRRFPRSDDPSIEVPDNLGSDFGPGDAEFAVLMPSELACERVVFTSSSGDSDEAPGIVGMNDGYQIPLKELRDQPEKWIDHLSHTQTREGYRPAIDVLADELRRRSGADA